MKTALITGITGQDGAYLAEFLLGKGYFVHGIKRRSSLFNTDRIDHLYQDPHEKDLRFKLHYGDLTDSTNLIRIIQETRPDEIYNLAAQSHVKVSFDTPEYTANADGVGMLRILEAVRLLDLTKKCRIYQASTSELYGLVQETPQTEKTPFYPRSPYGVAKLYAYWITVNYREAYDMFACNGILFNHESPVRGETFVTRKITRAAARIALGLQDTLYLGNLDASRDWGHARDYVEAMWLMLQQEKPEDYVIATGVTTTVRDFARMAFAALGVEVEFSGRGASERGVVIDVDEEKAAALSEGALAGSVPGVSGAGASDVGASRAASGAPASSPWKSPLRPGQTVIRVDERYYRPTEVDLLVGDAGKARRQLGWEPKYSLERMIGEMVHSDLHLMQKDRYLSEGGFNILNYFE